MSACDLLIRGGTIVDGSGSEPFVGDVAIHDGKIVSVGPFTGESREVIDATGLTVTPGKSSATHAGRSSLGGEMSTRSGG